MSQVNSPFKFLDSYQQDDADVFFGREKETIDLYNALSGVKHLLVYGPSGSGKTSLIECGLRNQFSDADWYALSIRKGVDINASVFASINNSLKDQIALDPVTKIPEDPKIEFGQAVEKLFAERYQPIYLLFDQFEELLISGETDEKNTFFTLLNKLIRNKLPCRIILIMREEFIGHLSEFEPLCPSIFQHRFRVEKMGRTNVEEVIYQILEAPKYRTYFNVDDSHKLAESILSKLPDKKMEIELAHVQVFLGELWERSLTAKKAEDKMPLLSADLVHDDDNLETILESFLKKQMKDLDEIYGENVSLELLAAMITDKFTKLQLSEAAIEEDLAHKNVVAEKPFAGLLKELEYRRIIRTLKVGDETKYEISHDLLALVVGQNRTEEMKMREKAEGIYKMYVAKQRRFNQDEIDDLRALKQSFPYPLELKGRIDESIAFLKKQSDEELAKTKKQLQKVRGLLGLAIIALVIAIFLGLFVQKLQHKTNDALLAARISDTAARKAKDSAIIAKNAAVMSDSGAHRAKDSAILEQKKAIKSDSAAKAQKDTADVARHKAETADSVARKARDSTDTALHKIRYQTLQIAANEYARLIREGPSADNKNFKQFYDSVYLLGYTYNFDNLKDSIKDKAAYNLLRDKLYYNNDLYQRLYENLERIKSISTVITLSATAPDLRTKPVASCEGFVSSALGIKQHVTFQTTSDNFIDVFDDENEKISSIAMGTKVTALDFNNDSSIIYFGTISGYIGYIKYGIDKKNQPIFKNKLETEVTAIQLFTCKKNGGTFLLAAGKKSGPIVYKLEGNSLTPDNRLIGNQLPYTKQLGDINNAEYDVANERVLLKTSSGKNYLWNPFSDEVLDSLKAEEKRRHGEAYIDSSIKKTNLLEQ